MPELHKIVPNFPIVFTKKEKSVTLCFLASFIPNNNLFIDQKGKWLGTYVPAVFRSVPLGFFLQKKMKIKFCVMLMNLDVFYQKTPVGMNFIIFLKRMGNLLIPLKRKYNLHMPIPRVLVKLKNY